MLELAAGHEAFEWFGRGPHETYPDRARGGRVGRWRSTVADQLVAYIRPQENGGHADTRWFRVGGPDGGIRVDLDRPGQVSATHSTAADLDAAAPRRRAPAPGRDDRPHRRRPPRRGDRELRARHVAPYVMGGGTYRWAWTLRTEAAGG